LQNAKTRANCNQYTRIPEPLGLREMAWGLLTYGQHFPLVIGVHAVLKLVSVALTALALSGCALLTAEKWPEHGGGGLAEFTASNDERIGAMVVRVDTLRNQGARSFAASDFENAEVLLARVQREFAGGLLIDGEANLHQLSVLVASIERRSPVQQVSGRARR
jgi:hypothetical protein